MRVRRHGRVLSHNALMTPPVAPPGPRHPLLMALALSLGAAVSLGVTRFAYGLLLPVMRDDLGWSYTLAGAMNTANALGYLLGALATPALVRRLGAARVLLGGAVAASAFMAASGFFTDAAMLLLQRLLAGVASAFVFVAGGLLAARLGAQAPERAGLLLGLYYGGTGWGIAASALGVPALLGAARGVPHGWAWAWWGLALLCLAATAVLAWPAELLRKEERMVQDASGLEVDSAPRMPWRAMAPALAGYTLFGVGYIGYMTFVIALLREQGLGEGVRMGFYALLGCGVIASSWLWAGLLQRWRGGQPVVLASGLLFGAVFLSVVASTTAFVRHNLPPARWATGISAFTILFAFGQIVGPTVVGRIADGPGGLARGLLYSAAALWLGALLAWRQKPLVS